MTRDVLPVAVVETAGIRIEIHESADGTYGHAIYNRDGDLVATATTASGSAFEVSTPAWHDWQRLAGGDGVVLRGTCGGADCSLTLRALPDAAAVHGDFKMTPPPANQIVPWTISYESRLGDPDSTFAPHIRPADIDVLGKWIFKTPAVFVERDGAGLGVLVDVRGTTPGAWKLPVALDMECDKLVASNPILGLGVRPHSPYRLCYFRESDEAIAVDGVDTIGLSYWIVVPTGAPSGQAHRELAGFVWDEIGRQGLAAGGTQVVPFEKYAEYGFTRAIPEFWTEFDTEIGRAGGVQNGKLWPNDIWFQSLYNHFRTSLGLRHFGEMTGRSEWSGAAEKIVNLALSSDADEAGPFATIFHRTVGESAHKATWVRSAHWMTSTAVADLVPVGIEKANSGKLVDWDHVYHTVDCSWLGYWMLRYQVEYGADQRIVDKLVPYANFLLEFQERSGAVPSFYDANDRLALQMLRYDGAGTSASGAFLCEMYRVTHDARYLAAARKAGKYIQTEVLDVQKWQDYEVVFDSVAKPLNYFDPHTRQWAQSLQCVVWTLAMYQSLWHATAEGDYRELSSRVADRLALAQQVWQPDYVSVNVFGGFPVGNSHPSWNDARTAQCATALIDQYEVSNRWCDLERGVAGLRASLNLMSIPENVAYVEKVPGVETGRGDEGYGGRGEDVRWTGFSFDFPVGSSITSFALALRKYGSVFIDGTLSRGIGIDGYTVLDVDVSEGAVAFESNATVSHRCDGLVRVAGVQGNSVDLKCNGTVIGTYTGDELDAGVSIDRSVLAGAGPRSGFTGRVS